MQVGDERTNQEASDHAGIERDRAQDGALAGSQVLRVDGTDRRQERAHHGVERHVADHAAQRRRGLLPLGEPIGQTHGEDKRDVAHHDARGRLQDREEDGDRRGPQPWRVLEQHGAREGVAEALQDARDRQDQNGRHQDLAQTLELRQQFIFVHIQSPLSSGARRGAGPVPPRTVTAQRRAGAPRTVPCHPPATRRSASVR